MTSGDDISLVRATVPSAIVAALMLACAGLITSYSGVDWSALPAAYTKSALAVSLIFLMLAVFADLVLLAVRKADDPIRGLVESARARSRLLVLPAIVTPLFLAGFTAAKSSMGHLVGFRWDAFFTELDAAIFGADPWRWTHALIGDSGTAALGFFYTFVWGFTIAFAKALIAIYGTRRFVGTFFLAMLSTWIVAGFLLAYLFTSAGPVFAHLVDSSLVDRFAPMLARLDQVLAVDSSVRTTQSYLNSAVFTLDAVKGGGVSAMPSMHIGAAMILVMAARGTLWIWPAAAFMALTWLGSVHFGYHYAVDGIPSAIVAVIAWKGAAAYFSLTPRVAAPRVSGLLPEG